MTDIIENSSSSLIGSLGSFSGQILIAIIILNLVTTIFCLLKCIKILSWINPKTNGKLSSSAVALSLPIAPTEVSASEMTSSEVKNSDGLLIDRAIKSIRAGFTQSQLSEKLDIEDEYLETLYRTYYKKLN